MTDTLPATQPPSISLAATLEELFGESRTTVPLRDGRTVQVRPAKIPQLRAVTQFMQTMLDNIPADKFTALIEVIADEQKDALMAGKSHTDIQVDAARWVARALGHQSLLLGLLTTSLDYLPGLLAEFCDLPARDLENLDLDELVAVAMGVLAVNYGFFTQSLPPIFKAVLGGWQAKAKRNAMPLGAQ